MSVLVIAEPGSTWGADLDTGYRSIDAAKQCGADAWKVQWVSDPARMAVRRHDATLAVTYQRYLAWPEAWLDKLKARCDVVGIEFMATCYLPGDVAVLSRYSRRLKISSFEASDRELVGVALDRADEVILSLGMGTQWRGYMERCRTLHCISGYPTPIEQLNLGAMAHRDGLSDHTLSVITGALAVAAGASIVEKHMCLSDTPSNNPDFLHSLVADGTLPDFVTYVHYVRLAEQAMGNGVVQAMPCEASSLRYRI
jgi:sialic acid synthase SpsE